MQSAGRQPARQNSAEVMVTEVTSTLSDFSQSRATTGKSETVSPTLAPCSQTRRPSGRGRAGSPLRSPARARSSLPRRARCARRAPAKGCATVRRGAVERQGRRHPAPLIRVLPPSPGIVAADQGVGSRVQSVEPALESAPRLLHRVRRSIGRDLDRLAERDHAAPEGQAHAGMVPAVEIDAPAGDDRAGPDRPAGQLGEQDNAVAGDPTDLRDIGRHADDEPGRQRVEHGAQRPRARPCAAGSPLPAPEPRSTPMPRWRTARALISAVPCFEIRQVQSSISRIMKGSIRCCPCQSAAMKGLSLSTST